MSIIENIDGSIVQKVIWHTPLKSEQAKIALKRLISQTNNAFNIPIESKTRIIKIAQQQLDAIEEALKTPAVPRKQ